MLGRIFQALTAGALTYLSLGVFPYFPQWWTLAFVLLITLSAYWFIKTAIFAAMAVFGISLLYQSPELFTLYLLAAVIAVIFSVRTQPFPRIFLLIVAAPFLAALNIFGRPLPIEFLIIFLAPLLAETQLAAGTIASIACLACCIAGIIGQQELMGNLVIGIPLYKFIALNSKPQSPFYNLSWLKEAFSAFDLSGALVTAVKLLKFMLYQPLVFLQVVAWGVTSSLLHFLIAKKKWPLDLLAAVIGIAMITVLQFIVLTLYQEKIPFSLTDFTLRAAIAMLIALVIWETKRAAAGKIAADDTENPRESENADDTPPTPPDREKIAVIQGLTLEESLQMQKKLQEYINRKFVREITALDIDVADSAKLKSEEQAENVLLAFRKYWKIVDDAIQRRRGKILTRSGDGAIYIFESADQAVITAQEILKEIDRFNKSINTLKSGFRVRQGINTGKIVADTSQKNSEIFSAALDIAGHLQKMANPGEILISESTYQKIRSKNEFAPAGICEKDQVQTYALKKKEPNRNIPF